MTAQSPPDVESLPVLKRISMWDLRIWFLVVLTFACVVVLGVFTWHDLSHNWEAPLWMYFVTWLVAVLAIFGLWLALSEQEERERAYLRSVERAIEKLFG